MQDRDVAAQFAATLREARERAGMSQEALAAAAGLNRTAVGKVERGEAQPKLATVLRLAGGLGCDPCDLLPEMRWKRASEAGRWE
ncbi:MAG: helix-turn-helix transcriptional regulator [Actinobacteria bacterium]|nr:helix-turn-helix transcriptional regulator [Actinomycetota bacterium]